MLRRSSKVSLRGDSARDSFSSYLLKRSGGHEGHTTLRKKFQERFFVLQGTNLLYFRSQDEYLAGGASLGSLGVEGSHLTVEEENAGADSCTFCIHTPQRQLLLVARPAAARLQLGRDPRRRGRPTTVADATVGIRQTTVATVAAI